MSWPIKLASPFIFIWLLSGFLLCAPASNADYIINGKSVNEEYKQAVDMTNEGARLVGENKLEEGEAKLRAALKIAPDIPAVYTNLGLCLMRKNQFAEAIPFLNKAIELDPTVAAPWLNLCNVYSVTGEHDKAIEAMKDFIKRFPNDDNASKIKQLIKIVQQQKRMASSSANSLDYFLEATGGTGVPHTWSMRSMPIPVYIGPGKGLQNYQDAYADEIKNAFRIWQEATGNIIRFTFVNSPGQADIEVKWTDNRSDMNNSVERGLTSTHYKNGFIYGAKIKIITLPINQMTVMSPMMMRTLGLHEIGHALGISGHSPNAKDIMFALSSTTETEPQLSRRDLRTIGLLYPRVGRAIFAAEQETAQPPSSSPPPSESQIDSSIEEINGGQSWQESTPFLPAEPTATTNMTDITNQPNTNQLDSLPPLAPPISRPPMPR